MIVTYGIVMRERSGQSPAATRTMKLRFKASHRRGVAPLRISHHGSAWEPPMKEIDRREDVPARHKGKR
jgi:hypothetical protein